MKSTRLWVSVGFALLSLGSSALTVAQAATESRGKLKNLMPPTLTRNCVLFTLGGVVEADPAIPGSPWFAIADTHPGFDKMFTLLLSVKQMSTTPGDPYVPILIAQTTGNSICGGFAEVSYVLWPG